MNTVLAKSLDILNGPFLLSHQSLSDALRVFETVPYSTLPITDSKRIYLGVISLRDLLLERNGHPTTTDITKHIKPLKPLHESDHVEQGITPGHHDIVPIINEDNTLAGLITKDMILRCTSDYYRLLSDQNHSILESSYNGIMAIDSNGNIIVFNPSAERILGRKYAEVIGKHISFVDSSAGLLEVVKNPQVTTGIRRQVNGKSILSNRTPLLCSGRCVGAMAVFLDISDYQMVCDELSVSKNLVKELNAIFESSYDGFYIANREGRVTRVNSAWEKFCGFSREEVVGKTAYELVGSKFYDKSAAVAALEQKKTVTFLVNITAGPCKGNQVMATGTPIFDEMGEIEQVVVNVRDMTDLEDLRRQLDSTVELNRRYESELEHIRLQTIRDDDLVAQSPAMRKVIEMAARIATVDSTVLVFGESGVGKEIVSNKIHAWSRRNDQSFIKINCGAIPEALLESELFGYAGGAFTGAKKEGKPGMFELASGGTLFLDEIGELPLSLQVKLLRVLQEKSLVRVGGVKTIATDVRIIAATNKNVPEMIKMGTFRDDLYYRLNVFSIYIPPLRQRREDLPPLLYSLLERFNAKYGDAKKFSPAAAERLMTYDWPGNVREMENVIERMVVLVNEPIIEISHLPETLRDIDSVHEQPDEAVSLNRLIPYQEALAQMEQRLLKLAMAQHLSTREIANLLGLNQSTVVRKMQHYELNRNGSKH